MCFLALGKPQINYGLSLGNHQTNYILALKNPQMNRDLTLGSPQTNSFMVRVSGLSIRLLSKTCGSFFEVRVSVLGEPDSFGVQVLGFSIGFILINPWKFL